MVPSHVRKLATPHGDMLERVLTKLRQKFYKIYRIVKLNKRQGHFANRKSSGKEDNEFNVIVSELKKLEDNFSTDVAVLREQIELASLDFTEAQKTFDKLERDYIAAKLELFVKKERKEQLTAHLCSFIKKNEIEKAKTISGFVGKLELAPCPMEKLINEQGALCDRQTQDERDTSKDSAENITGQ